MSITSIWKINSSSIQKESFQPKFNLENKKTSEFDVRAVSYSDCYIIITLLLSNRVPGYEGHSIDRERFCILCAFLLGANASSGALG